MHFELKIIFKKKLGEFLCTSLIALENIAKKTICTTIYLSPAQQPQKKIKN
jgi:hypothetical protein